MTQREVKTVTVSLTKQDLKVINLALIEHEDTGGYFNGPDLTTVAQKITDALKIDPTVPGVTEVVVNSCYGGFNISIAAAKELIKLGVKAAVRGYEK